MREVREYYTLSIFAFLLFNLKYYSLFIAANWAQLAGSREQNTATPYVPDEWHRNRATSNRPMWSARWGHAVVVLDEYVPEKNTLDQPPVSSPVIVLLGGDDGLPRDLMNITASSGTLKVAFTIELHC